VVNTTTEEHKFDKLEASSGILEPLFDKFPSNDGQQRASARIFAQVKILLQKTLDHSNTYTYPPGIQPPDYTVDCLYQMIATNQWPS